MSEDQDILEEIYTPFSQLEKEIERRSNDHALVERVRLFWKEHPFPYSFEGPRAIFNREIITPNREMQYFMDLVSSLNMEPLLLEYPAGKFVNKNKNKYFLCKLLFSKEKATMFDDTKATCRVVDFNIWEGKPLSDVKTIWGDSLIETHRELLESVYPSVSKNIVNITDWFNTTRHITEYYYLYFMSLFICDGVLFENFMLSDESEREFFFEKILPSFRKATEIFGVKPLIFPLLPIEHEKDPFWYSHDHNQQHVIKKKMI